jgi:prepilin-type processing-associated H-X9-DG protein
MCKSDPFVTAPAVTTDPSGKLYADFQNDKQISYSFAYPYAYAIDPTNPKAAGTFVVGPWWKNTTNASIPIAADMAPLNGTGSPARNVSITSTGMSASGGISRAANSGNHQSDGQNVVFADGHVDFSHRPDVGEANDNIYTLGDTHSAPGTQPVKTPLKITTMTDPFDIYMVPARDLNTGGL